jgi:hypothetical protein
MGCHAFVFAAAAAAAAAVATGSQAAHAGIADGARVTKGVESAMVRRSPSAPWRRVGADGRVPATAEVRCDELCSVAVDPDNTFVLTPGAIIAVSDYFYVPLVPDAQRLVPAHRVLLIEGLVEAVSSERGLPLVVTVGANEHVALRAARVQIARRENHTAVSVLEGQARAGASRSWVTLEAKQATVLVPHDRPKAPEPAVQAPKWTSAGEACSVPPLALSEQGKEANVGVCWEAASRGAVYRVELARDSSFREPLANVESTGRSWSKLLGAGRYFVRVRSVDADGLSSEPSAPRKIAVVPLMLPPGSLADASKAMVVLPEGRELSFGDPDGLEVATDKGGFVKAPSALRMDGSPSHQLRFRLSDDPSSVSTVHVLRRALRADVRITPRTPRWGTDPIDVSVTIEDPTGLANTDQVEPQLHVLLGMTEVPLSWNHRGAVWSARVEPRRMGGPTVLRVIANDEHGTTLGRNFVEIESTATRTQAPTAPRFRLANE